MLDNRDKQKKQYKIYIVGVLYTGNLLVIAVKLSLIPSDSNENHKLILLRRDPTIITYT